MASKARKKTKNKAIRTTGKAITRPAKPKVKAKPKKRDRRTTGQRQSAFLETFAETCNIWQAAKRAGIGRTTHYRWLVEDQAYVGEFDKVQRAAGEHVESTAVSRATDGWLEPVHYQGRVCGHVRRFSDGLAQFLLRGLLPDKYGNKTEISGPQGEPVQAKIEVIFVKPKKDDGDDSK